MQEASAVSIDATEWQPIVSGNAHLKLSAASAGRTAALQLDFDFKGGGGFVVARRALNRTMPEDYSVNFRLRGRGAVNNLEIKLVDATGQNVWRHVQKDLKLPERWTRMTVTSRDIEFAWGPAGGGARLSSLGSMEVAIVAGEGGQGTVWISDLRIEDNGPSQAPTANASSALSGHEACEALAGAGWRPRPDDPRPWIAIDFGEPRTLGGLIVDWREQAPARGFRIRASSSGLRWKTLHAAAAAGGKRSYVYLPGVKTRFLRLELEQTSAGASLRPQAFEFSRSIHAFWNNVAKGEERGWHPRWLHAEQTYWTPFGTSNGVHCALMNEDGMVEVDQGSFSVEPMLWADGRLFTWADVVARQELKDGWIPVPTVIWETAQWRLSIQGEATPSRVVRMHYRLENLTGQALSARLFLLMRPFQVTPPWQSFREVGGVSPIRSLELRDAAVCINDTTLIVSRSPALGFAAMTFDEGFMPSHLAAGSLPTSSGARDAFGFATGALAFEWSIAPHGATQTAIDSLAAGAIQPSAEAAFDWGAKLAVNQWAGSGWMEDAVHAALTATAHILVTRSGPALQPGPRRYTRSWIRDGAMMSAALLRMGHAEEVRDFIRWYAPNQRADGFVPCCVDREGVDWLVEHDSHGELLALIADYFRFNSDRVLLEECWTFIDRAVGCIERLLGPDGLLPISVSHEGYLAQPVHSYWDDFWALRGLRDAVYMAQAAGRDGAAQQWRALCARFETAVFASIEATRAQRKLDFIPGSIEWADFDPTATANAIYLLDVPEGLNRAAVERTFDKYLADWRAKRSGDGAWSNYTPYEIRIIGALVRLGRRDAALELLRFFLSDRRPVAWNQWPEIAWRDRQAPAHLGDLPHTWIAGEYVLAFRSLIAYEREADECLILAAGLAPEWLEGAGVQVQRMPTLVGSLSYSLRRIDANTLRFEIDGGIMGKILLRPPLTSALRSVTVNGRPYTSFNADSVTLFNTPAEVICTTE